MSAAAAGVSANLHQSECEQVPQHRNRNMARCVRMLDQSQFHFVALHGASILAQPAENFSAQICTLQQSESAIFAEAGIGGSEQFGRLELNLQQRRAVSLFGVALEDIVHPQCGIIVRPTPLMTMRAASASRSCFPGSFA